MSNGERKNPQAEAIARAVAEAAAKKGLGKKTEQPAPVEVAKEATPSPPQPTAEQLLTQEEIDALLGAVLDERKPSRAKADKEPSPVVEKAAPAATGLGFEAEEPGKPAGPVETPPPFVETQEQKMVRVKGLMRIATNREGRLRFRINDLEQGENNPYFFDKWAVFNLNLFCTPDNIAWIQDKIKEVLGEDEKRLEFISVYPDERELVDHHSNRIRLALGGLNKAGWQKQIEKALLAFKAQFVAESVPPFVPPPPAARVPEEPVTETPEQKRARVRELMYQMESMVGVVFVPIGSGEDLDAWIEVGVEKLCSRENAQFINDVIRRELGGDESQLRTSHFSYRGVSEVKPVAGKNNWCINLRILKGDSWRDELIAQLREVKRRIDGEKAAARVAPAQPPPREGVMPAPEEDFDLALEEIEPHGPIPDFDTIINYDESMGDVLVFPSGTTFPLKFSTLGECKCEILSNRATIKYGGSDAGAVMFNIVRDDKKENIQVEKRVKKWGSSVRSRYALDTATAPRALEGLFKEFYFTVKWIVGGANPAYFEGREVRLTKAEFGSNLHHDELFELSEGDPVLVTGRGGDSYVALFDRVVLEQAYFTLNHDASGTPLKKGSLLPAVSKEDIESGKVKVQRIRVVGRYEEAREEPASAGSDGATDAAGPEEPGGKDTEPRKLWDAVYNVGEARKKLTKALMKRAEVQRTNDIPRSKLEKTEFERVNTEEDFSKWKKGEVVLMTYDVPPVFTSFAVAFKELKKKDEVETVSFEVIADDLPHEIGKKKGDILSFDTAHIGTDGWTIEKLVKKKHDALQHWEEIKYGKYPVEDAAKAEKGYKEAFEAYELAFEDATAASREKMEAILAYLNGELVGEGEGKQFKPGDSMLERTRDDVVKHFEDKSSKDWAARLWAWRIGKIPAGKAVVVGGLVGTGFLLKAFESNMGSTPYGLAFGTSVWAGARLGLDAVHTFLRGMDFKKGRKDADALLEELKDDAKRTQALERSAPGEIEIQLEREIAVLEKKIIIAKGKEEYNEPVTDWKGGHHHGGHHLTEVEKLERKKGALERRLNRGELGIELEKLQTTITAYENYKGFNLTSDELKHDDVYYRLLTLRKKLSDIILENELKRAVHEFKKEKEAEHETIRETDEELLQHPEVLKKFVGHLTDIQRDQMDQFIKRFGREKAVRYLKRFSALALGIAGTRTCGWFSKLVVEYMDDLMDHYGYTTAGGLAVAGGKQLGRGLKKLKSLGGWLLIRGGGRGERAVEEGVRSTEKQISRDV